MSINNINPKFFDKNSKYTKTRIFAGVISPIVILGTLKGNLKSNENIKQNNNYDIKYTSTELIEKDTLSREGNNLIYLRGGDLYSFNNNINDYHKSKSSNTNIKSIFSNKKITSDQLFNIVKKNNEKANFNDQNKISDKELKKICEVLSDTINNNIAYNRINLNLLSEKIINLKIQNYSNLSKQAKTQNYNTITFDLEKISKNEKIFKMTIEYESLCLIQSVIKEEQNLSVGLKYPPYSKFKNVIQTTSYMLNLVNYDDFLKCLIKDKFVKKNFINDRYVYQGCCDVNGLCVSSAYDSGYRFKKNNKTIESNIKIGNSILEISDLNGKSKILKLDCNAHVGGVAYDKDSKKVFVSGNGSINIYDVAHILNSSNSSKLNKYNTYKLNKKVDGIDRASYLASYNNNLFVGMFDPNNSTKLSKYSLNEDGDMTLSSQYTVPYKSVQGLCVTNYKGKEYYIFSCSQGRKNDSVLMISELNNGTFKTVKSLQMPAMLEQISMSNDGNIMAIFESGCAKYNGADGNGESIDKIDDVCYLDVEKVISL